MAAAFRWHPQKVIEAVKAGVADGLRQIGIMVTNDMRTSMTHGVRIPGHRITRRKAKEVKVKYSTVKKVRLVKVTTTTKTRWIAAPPGFPPGVRTGNLRRECNYRVVAWNHVQVGSWARYARYLELGTHKTMAKKVTGYWLMAPRPFIRPAVARIKPKVQQIIAAAIKRRLRSVA